MLIGKCNMTINDDILNLRAIPANVDGESSPAYTAAVIDKAHDLIPKAEALLQSKNIEAELGLAPGPRGSVDILVTQQQEFKGVFNVPAENAPVTYYIQIDQKEYRGTL